MSVLPVRDRNNTILVEGDRVRTHVIGKYVPYGPRHIRNVPEGIVGSIFLFTGEGDVRVQIEVDDDIVLVDYRPSQLSKF